MANHMGHKPYRARNRFRTTKRALRKAIMGCKGIVREVADRLGIERTGVYPLLRKWPSMKKLLREEGDRLIDTGERELFYLLEQRRNLPAKAAIVKWVLSTRGASRGYGDPVQHLKLSGGDTPIRLENSHTIDIEKLQLPLTLRKQLLEAIEATTSAVTKAAKAYTIRKKVS